MFIFFQVVHFCSEKRWNNELPLPFDCIFSMRHLCQKLPKFVDIRRYYNVQHQCRFFRHNVYVKELDFVSAGDGVYYVCQQLGYSLFTATMDVSADRSIATSDVVSRLWVLVSKLREDNSMIQN